MRRVHSQENKNHFDRQFREGLRNSSVTPPDGLWDRVSYNLDEERAKAKYDHWYYAILILLIPLTIAQILVSDEFAEYYSSVETIDLMNWQTYTGNAKIHPTQLLATKESMLGPYKHNDFYNKRRNEIQAQDVTSEKDLVQRYEAAPINSLHNSFNVKAEKNIHDYVDGVTLSAFSAADISEAESSKSAIEEGLESVKGFHFGFGGGINNSWLIDKNSDLYPSLGVDYDIQQKPDFAPFYGLSVGYDFSEKYGVAVEWVIKAMQGQKFVENRYNKLPIQGEIDLHYMHLPVMFKYKFSKVSHTNFQPRVLNLIAGLQYSRLRDARVAFEDLEVLNANDNFNRNQLGFIVGVEYDLFLNKNYFFTFGARSTFTTDVTSYPSSAGNEGYYSNGRKGVYNVLLGVHTSINYMMRNKKRGSK